MWLPAHLPQQSDLVVPCHDIQIDIVSAYRPSIHVYNTCTVTSVVVPSLRLPSCYDESESRKFKSYGLLRCLLRSLKRNDDADVLLLIREAFMSCLDYPSNCAVSLPHDSKF